MLLATTACSTFEADPRYDEAGAADSLYVALTISLDRGGVTSRAATTPMGGEEGDGWEYGRDYENRLHDFSVFVLAGGADINSPAATTFAGRRYFSEDDVSRAVLTEHDTIPTETAYVYENKDVLTYDFTIPVVRRLTAPEAGTLRFIIVANMGDCTAEYTTLGQLRDAQPKQTWTPATKDGETPTRFVMTNENTFYYATGTGTIQDPLRLHVMLERMAARIDFDPTGATADGQSLRYDLKGGDDDQTLAHLYVDNMRVVNAAQPASYLIKRVATDLSGAGLTYLGDETPVPSGQPQTNWVIEPNTARKTADNTTNATLLSTLYGPTDLTAVADDITKLTPPDVPLATDAPATLAYTNENTYSREATLSSYATGVCLRCRFEPLHDYYTAYDATTDALTKGTYTLGQTFTMVEVNDPALSEPRRLYFENETDAQAYAGNTPKKHFATVTTFTNGVCYYFLWLRHANNVDVIHDVMEFATVRNNIYRFRINSTSGPGTPTPDARHPEQLRARVYVKKWLLVEHPTILM